MYNPPWEKQKNGYSQISIDSQNIKMVVRVTAPFPFPLRFSSSTSTKMAAFNPKSTGASFATATAPSAVTDRKFPVLLFDIMDTIVSDPFYHDVAPFFGMSFEELLESKHPTAWIEFEEGKIDEMELSKKFFKDGRPFDLEGLKDLMKRGYSYIDGVEELLNDLKQNEYEIHAFTNYPIWYKMIEEKLKISAYLSWTFCSCVSGKRKPDPAFYQEVLRHLQVDPKNCFFVDDRLKNVEAANELGIIGIHFKNTDSLRGDLVQMGITIKSKDECQKA